MEYDFTRPAKGFEYNCLEIERPKPGLMVIKLNRPDKMNALSFRLTEELETILQELKFDNTTRVVILTGNGRGFCAGVDLKDISGFTRESESMRQFWYMSKHMLNIIELMRQIPQPIICAINGVAAGGGASLTLASDIRVCAANAKIVFAYINVGVSGADMGSSYLLPRLIGHARANELLVTGGTLKSEEAERVGLVAKVVEPEALMDTAMEYADILLGKSEMGLLLTKESINAAMDGVSLGATLNFENRNQFICNAMGTFSSGADKFAKK